MLWAAALVACAVTHLALATPANVTASAATPAASPQSLLAGNGAVVPAAGPAAARQAAQTLNASGVPYNLSAPAQGPAPGSDPASYARRRTVPVSNGTHILYNVSVVTADGSPAPLAATPFAPDQTLYTATAATPPPTAPASNTPLITWVTIAGGVVGAALLASSVLLLTDLWNGRLLCLCCRQPRRPPPPEPRASARDGPRELRLPVLVVNPGKDVVVAQRVSMDRANTGAQLPVLDDYVFHKTSSNADQAGMSAMVEAQLEQWRSQATTASGCLPETLSPRPSRPLPASPPLSRADTLSPHPSTRLPRGAGAGSPPCAPNGLGRGDPLSGPAHAGAASAAAAAAGCNAAEPAASASGGLQIVVHPAGRQSRDGTCSAPGRAAGAPAGCSQAAPTGAWGRSAGQRAPPPPPPPPGAACSGSARFVAGAAGASWAAGQPGSAGGGRAAGRRSPSGAGVAAGAGTEGGGAASGAGVASGAGLPGAARPWPARVAVSPFALDALQLQRRASE